MQLDRRQQRKQRSECRAKTQLWHAEDYSLNGEGGSGGSKSKESIEITSVLSVTCSILNFPLRILLPNLCYLKAHLPCRRSARAVPLRNRRKPLPASARAGSGFCT